MLHTPSLPRTYVLAHAVRVHKHRRQNLSVHRGRVSTVTVRLLPGVPGKETLDEIDRLINSANDARGGDARDVYSKYVRWASDAARALSARISHEDVTRLILTQRHWVIQGLDQDRQATTLAVQLELEQRASAFQAVRDEMRAELAAWPATKEPEWIVVPDTNVFLEHKDEFRDIDWAAIVHSAAFESIHIVIPLVVIDELDRAKRNDRVKTRARSTLKALDQMALRPGHALSIGKSSQDGDVDVRLLPEEAGHVRLADADLEIADVAQSLRDLTGRRVVLVTFDTGMVVRARSRSAGVTVKKLFKED